MHTLVPRGEAAPSGRKRRILIVDDHIFFAACLRTLLDHESDLMVCDVVAHCSDLEERVRRLRPDLLVIDLTLGSESGLSVARHLRAHDVRTPILFVSTLTRPTRAQLAGINLCAFVPKGKHPAEFLAVLREILLAPSESARRKSTAMALTKTYQPA